MGNLSEEEVIEEVVSCITAGCMLLEHLRSFDKDLYDKFIKNIEAHAGIENQIDYAMQRMFDNLYELEVY
ncbi:hypothetical protein [Metabacillus fastidiosus]|uniref:hypothetical protein n=1 Tax=Metabacillus fastidiosus TaxID=1458 RepID=UPI002E20F297|nr:hypothetical protein [Metabacillus fastidiosus]